MAETDKLRYDIPDLVDYASYIVGNNRERQKSTIYLSVNG